MPRFYLLRHRTFSETFFAGFKQGSSFCVLRPVFVQPEKGVAAQASVIHEDDIKEAEEDLRKYGIDVDRVQVA